MGDDISVYDLKGLKWPLPVLKTRRRLKDMPAQAEFCVETSDHLTDIPHFCRKDGHALPSTVQTESGHRFLIRERSVEKISEF